jgi:acyl-coenzyme A thioesterase PaaI-like protein
MRIGKAGRKKKRLAGFDQTGFEMTDENQALLDRPFSDCEPFSYKVSNTSRKSFVSGDPDPIRLVVRYWVRKTDQHFLGRAYFGPHAEGPPGHAHGGSMAALLDEAMGLCSWSAGHPVLAANINVRFLKSMALNKVVEVHAWIDKVQGRKISVRAEIRGENRERYTESSGLFVVLSHERLAEMKMIHSEE